MDSLFATYASSSDDEQQPQRPPSTKPRTSLFSSLPNPLSSSLFSILPPPCSQITPISLPNPNPNPNPNPKRVVQFRPPQPIPRPNLPDDDDDDDDEETIEERERKKRRQLSHDTSVKSFLSSIPAPKNSAISSLGTAPGARRSIIDTAPTPTPIPTPETVPDVGIEQNVDDGSHLYTYDDPTNGYENYEQMQYYDDGNNSWNNNNNNNNNNSVLSSGIDSFVGMGGGRRRKDQLPPKIVEVKQDELIKNRPTEDKSKLTGMTYGPSYQPASSKGKPSKLHKRKHQIGSLYFDMRQNEPELAERRAKGFLTKAETHAKYGW